MRRCAYVSHADCRSIRPFVCLSLCLSVCLSVLLELYNLRSKKAQIRFTESLDVAAPLSAPLNLRYSSLTKDAVTLVWDELECRQRGGTLLYYDVRLDDVDERSDVIVEHVTSPTAEFAVLTPYRRYAARVRYVNSVSVGPYSTQIAFTTLATGKHRTCSHLLYASANNRRRRHSVCRSSVRPSVNTYFA